jgi:type VI secretion system secreted protein VgrG
VRSLRAGQWFADGQSTLDALSELGQAAADREFSVHTVHSLGINNLPKELSHQLAHTAHQEDALLDLTVPGA